MELPPGARLSEPASSAARPLSLWLLTGRLEIAEDGAVLRLEAGDCLILDRPAARVFANPSARVACHYLLAAMPD